MLIPIVSGHVANAVGPAPLLHFKFENNLTREADATVAVDAVAFNGTVSYTDYGAPHNYALVTTSGQIVVNNIGDQIDELSKFTVKLRLRWTGGTPVNCQLWGINNYASFNTLEDEFVVNAVTCRNSGTSTVYDGNWHDFTWYYDGNAGIMRIYDGTSIVAEKTTGVPATTGTMTSGRDMVIGNGNTATLPWLGELDNFILYADAIVPS